MYPSISFDDSLVALSMGAWQIETSHGDPLVAVVVVVAVT